MSEFTIKDYLNNIDTKKEVSVKLPISDSKNIEVKIKTLLSLDESSSLVNSIVNALFEDNRYTPELYEPVYWKGILAYYTDLNVEDIDNESLIKLIYESDLPQIIMKTINSSQINDIDMAIHVKTELINNTLLNEQRQALVKAIDEVEYCAEKYQELLNVFSEIDIKEVFSAIKDISALDEEKITNNVLKYKAEHESDEH